MAIDTNTKITAGFFYKWMTVKKMKEILSALEDSDVLIPNMVGNLTVHHASDNRYLGYIDFNLERYEPLEEATSE